MLLASLYAEHSPGTVSNIVSTLRELATYAQLRGWADRSAIEPNDAPVRAPQAPHDLYTPAETEKLIGAAVGVRGAGQRFSALLLTLSETGCRIGEALDLTWAAVHADAAVAHAVLPSTKSGKPQYLALSMRVVEEVFSPSVQARLMGEHGRFSRDPAVYVFPWVYCSLRTMFARLCERCAVPNHGFHAFRHTKATSMLAKGVPIQAVAALLRHSSVAITDRYYNATNALQYAKYLE
jgi:integrase